MNTRGLRKRRKGWAAVVYVPERLQEAAAVHYGSKSKKMKEIVRGLDTRDLKEANRLKLAAISTIQSELSALESGEDEGWLDDANKLSKRTDINASQLEHEAKELAMDVLRGASEQEYIPDESAHQYHPEEAVEYAQEVYEVATRQRVLVSEALEKWKVAATGITPGTLYQYSRDVQAFIDWSGDCTVQSVNGSKAANWHNHLKITPTRNKSKIAPNTLQRKVGSLNRLWKWMKARKVYTGENPWSELLEDVPGEAKRGSVVKDLRAMTRDEARKYLRAVKASSSKYKKAGADLLTLFWHTGVRPEDLSALTVEQVLKDDDEGVCWLTILKGKTEANTRLMPVVSPEALRVLERRLKGAKGGFLFNDCPSS